MCSPPEWNERLPASTRVIGKPTRRSAGSGAQGMGGPEEVRNRRRHGGGGPRLRLETSRRPESRIPRRVSATERKPRGRSPTVPRGVELPRIPTARSGWSVGGRVELPRRFPGPDCAWPRLRPGGGLRSGRGVAAVAGVFVLRAIDGRPAAAGAGENWETPQGGTTSSPGRGRGRTEPGNRGARAPRPTCNRSSERG